MPKRKKRKTLDELMTFPQVIVFLFLLLYISTTQALAVPYSQNEVLEEINLIRDFIRVEPFDSLSLQLETNFWIWHDQDNLYLKIKSDQGHSLQPGRYTADDVWPQSDFIRIQIITDVKNYYSYCYYFFPLGNKYDGVRDSRFKIDKNWDSSYSYKSEFINGDWVVSASIPFKDLRFFPHPPYNWKIIITRYLKETNEHFSFPGVHTKMGNDYFRKAADLIINREIRKSQSFFVRPYIIGSYDSSRDNWEFDENNMGIDFSYYPDFSSKFNISINPDFTDVPIDDEIDIYNLKYTPAYAENRFFFIEDFNAFGLDYDTFYSRHIKQPLYALKITRNTPELSWGLLSIKDKNLDSGQDYFNIISVNPTGKYYRLNFSLLSRANEDYHNEVLQIAPRMEFSENKFIWVNLKSSYRDHIDEKIAGYHFATGFEMYKSNFLLTMKAEQMSEDFSLDMGKIFEDDFFGWQIYTETNRDINRQLLRTIDFSIWISEELNNKKHDLLERFLISELVFEFNFNLELTIDAKFVREQYSRKYFNKNRVGIIFNWDKYNWFNIIAGYFKLDALIYDPGLIKKADYFQVGLKGDLGKHLAFSILADNLQYRDLKPDYNMDDNYWIINSDLSLNLSNQINCTAGLRYNNYNWYKYTEHVGYFLNFRWEYWRDCNLFIGYKYSADEINTDYNTNYEIFYLKIVHTL